jgi:hypothetical protein
MRLKCQKTTDTCTLTCAGSLGNAAYEYTIWIMQNMSRIWLVTFNTCRTDLKGGHEEDMLLLIKQ